MVKFSIPTLTSKEKNYIKNTFFDFESINNIRLNAKAMELLYFNQNIIHPLLYEFDKIIKLNSIENLNKISYYFYLSLLITNSPNITYYYYSIQFIRNINKYNMKLNNSNNNIKKLIISKVIIDLIKYYRGLKEFGNNLEEIKKIEDDNLQIMEEIINNLNGLNLNMNKIKSKSIEEIYLKIIIFIIENKLGDFDYIKEVLKQLDIESIKITQIMFEKIKAVLSKEEDINKYLISEEEDLFDENKINLYYILLKYIFKERIYIDQIDIFRKTREIIIEYLNKSSNNFDNSNDDNKERLEYIIKILNITKNQHSSNLNKESLRKSEVINAYSSSSNNDNNNNKNEAEAQNFFLIKANIIGSHQRKKGEDKKEKEYTAEFVFESNKYFISGGTNNEIIFYKNDSSPEIKINNLYSSDDWVYNILELEENNFLITERKQIYSYKSDKNSTPNKIKEDINSLFTLQNGENYIICSQNKVLLHGSNLMKSNILNDEKVFIDKYTAKAAIIINNHILLKSNKICSMGNDRILLYNLLSYKKVYNKLDEYSFIYSTNGLTPLSINIKNEKNNKIINKTILLCACKKYIKDQKNGILLIMNMDENTENNIKDIRVKTDFYDTGNFEVFCFCPILKYETNDFFIRTSINTNYFLAGGFIKAKSKGIIRLYKLVYSYEKCESRIEFIQDIDIIDKNDSNKFIRLKKPVSCITQSRSIDNLLITCWDGNVYSLEILNIKNYLKYDELFEKNIFFKDI